MPHLISQEEALRRVAAERGGDRGCLMCGVLSRPLMELSRGRWSRAVLTRFPRRWGHIMVLLDEHVTTFSGVSPEAWGEMNALALSAARALEGTLDPLRCYIASLGTCHEHLPMSSPHLHLHVIPLDDPEDRPRTVLTWREGTVQASEAEWEGLHRRLMAAWPVAVDRGA